jgi:hypothetical protein
VNSTVRFSNRLLTMRRRVDVKADEFHDSLGTVAEVVGPWFQVRGGLQINEIPRRLW